MLLLLLHRGRLKPDPGAAGEEHTWQRPSVLTAPIRFCSQNLQIYLHLLLSSSLSVLTLAPASSCETIALPLVTATGIRSTAKIRIFWGSANENNPPVHEKANIFLLLVESGSQRPRELISIFLSYTNYSSHNKVWKTSFIFENMDIGLLQNTLSFCISILRYLTCLFWNERSWLESSP